MQEERRRHVWHFIIMFNMKELRNFCVGELKLFDEFNISP
jgi:hypothetical protein